MASLQFDGVTFTVYTMVDEPRRVHGFFAEIEAAIELRLDGAVALVNRTDAVRSSAATKAEVEHVLQAAATHFPALVELWETRHA